MAYLFFNSTFVRLFYGSYFIISIGYYAYKELKETVDFIRDSITFSRYEVEAKEKMKKLGGNPEDLDKEESV